MVKKKPILKKKVLKKTSLTNEIKEKKGKTKPSLKRPTFKKPPSSLKRLKTVEPETPEINEVEDEKIWKKKKRDYWRNRFGQILDNLLVKGKDKKQVS